MKRTVIAIIASVAFFAACDKAVETQDGKRLDYFYASIDAPTLPSTRVTAEKRISGEDTLMDIKWAKNDTVLIIDNTGGTTVRFIKPGKTKKYIADDSGEFVKFVPVDTTDKPLYNTPISAFYGFPKNGAIPAVYNNYKSGDVSHLPMFAFCDDNNNLHFKNVFGVFRMEITNAQNLTGVKIEPSSKDLLYGLIEVNTSNMTGGISESASSYAEVPYGSSLTVNIDSNDSTKLIYIPVAQTASTTWKFSFITNSGTYTKTSKAHDVVINTMYDFKFDMNEITAPE